RRPDGLPMVVVAVVEGTATAPQPVGRGSAAMEGPRRRPDGEAAPTYAKDSRLFTVEVIHGGFFFGSGQNRCYLDGKKVSYDYCQVESAYYKLFEELVEHLGYEKRGRIDMYWLPPGCQLNEGGARLLSNDVDVDCMYLTLNRGHQFQMIYLDHLDSHISGGGAGWDDVVANPVTQMPVVFSPMKKSSNANDNRDVEESNTSCSVVDESHEIQSHDQLFDRLRPRKQNIEEQEEQYADSDTSDSDYIPEIIDSDYDLEDGDEDLLQEQLHPLQDRKGKKVVEECNSEDEELDAPDSDQDEMKFNFKSFTAADMHEPKFHAGQLFSSVELLRKAVREYSCKERVNITFPKNDKTRLGAKCEKGCPWYLYASWDNRTNSIMVKTFNGEHTCEKKWQVTAFTARYIAHKFVDKIRACERISLKALAGFVQEDWNMTIKRGKLGRARKIAYDIIYGDEIAQYNLLWDYANELRRSNPSSTFFVELSDEGQFQKCYFSFDACKRGFLSACRPIIFLDGCHLKTQYGGVLLSAVGMDPNDCIIPVAHAVVQSEDTKAWRWFLTALKQDLGIHNTDLWTIMSDKQKGLLKAVKELFPLSPHRFCVRHLWQNFNKNFKGEALKNQLWKCARSTTEGRFRENMNQMLVLSKEAHDWLDELDPKTWVRAYQNDFPKCDVLLNNNCEVFNRYILEAREMPIISMCQRIKGQNMGRNYGKQQEEFNLQTAGVLNHDQPLYHSEMLATLTQERESRQREEVVHGPLPENAFIQQQALSQPPIQPTTATKTGDVHRKREVVAFARLRAAAERREIADQAKFDAAIAKLKEEEDKIKLSAQKKKDDQLAKKHAAEEKKKAALEKKKELLQMRGRKLVRKIKKRP
uniref:MULE transposase domain-containing protein n=1 Tax=Aegilops tauschii subsp. strangulata TaxID=200361 RepID=A0A453FFS2_AEGTS